MNTESYKKNTNHVKIFAEITASVATWWILSTQAT